MKQLFTLEYWIDDNYFVGKIKEVPGVFSQGETLEELEENIKDAYQMMHGNEKTISFDVIKNQPKRCCNSKLCIFWKILPPILENSCHSFL